MPNFYQLMTLQYGFFMDVFGGAPNSPRGTAVDGYTKNSPPSDNQLWWFEPGPGNNPGYFYIRSKLSPDLFLDVKGGSPLPHTPLQIWTQNSPNQSANQLWKYVPSPAVAIIPQGYIQSLLAPNSVIDLAGGQRATRGTQLIIFPLNSPVSPNQIWFPIPNPNNQYSPLIEVIEPTILGSSVVGFSVTGDGFHAGSIVLGSYTYTINETDSLVAAGSFSTSADLGGTFVAEIVLISEGVFVLDKRPGTLELFISISLPQYPQSVIIADWNGSAFTIRFR